MSVPATLLVDTGYLIILGALFGVVAAAGSRRALPAALAVLALFGVGLPVGFYLLWPEWMWGYYAEPARVPGWIVTMLFSLYVPVFLAAFFVARELGRGGWWIVAGGVAVQAVLIGLTWERYRRTGSFASEPGPPESALAVSSALLVVGVALLWWWARRGATGR